MTKKEKSKLIVTLVDNCVSLYAQSQLYMIEKLTFCITQ